MRFNYGNAYRIFLAGFLLRHDFEKSQKGPKDPLFFILFLWRLLDTEIMLGFPAPRLFGRSQ